MTNSYYWSDDWSEEFYIELSKAGFISTTHETKDGLVLLPELQYDYAILDFENLHISHKVKKLINETHYELNMNSRFNEVVEKFSTHHKYNCRNRSLRRRPGRLRTNRTACRRHCAGPGRLFSP